MIPRAIERNYPKRLLTAGWWHMSLFQQLASDPNVCDQYNVWPRTARGLVIFFGSGLIGCLLWRWVLPEKKIGDLKLAFLPSLRGQSLRTPVDAPPQSLVSASSSTRFR